MLPSVNDLVDSVKKSLGGAGDDSPSARTKEPWDRLNKEEAFFAPYKIDAKRWDQAYDYRLLVVDEKNRIINDKGRPGGGGGVYAFYRPGTSPAIVAGALSRWEFALPISPQNLSISTMFAVTNTPTAKGIIEEHGGVRYKIINVRASTGVWRDRPSLDEPEKAEPGLAEAALRSVFANTIDAANRLAQTASQLAKVASGQHPRSAAAIQYELEKGALRTTGYYKALQLEQFLEQYAIAKKDPKNRGWRLVFDMPKLNQSYVVTPQAFSLEKTSERALEHTVSFQLKAWKRVDLNASPKKSQEEGLRPLEEPGFLETVVATVRQARAVLGDAKDLVRSVRGDAEAPFEALRQISLMAKDAAGLAVSAADLRRDVLSGDLVRHAFADAVADLETARLIEKREFSEEELAAVRAAKDYKNSNEGAPSSAGPRGARRQNRADLIPALASVSQDPDRFPRLLEQITLDAMPLPAVALDVVEAESASLRRTTATEARAWKAALVDLGEALAASFGEVPESYSSILGRPQAPTRPLPMSDEEAAILDALNETVQVLESMAARDTLARDVSAQDDLDLQSALGALPPVDARSKTLVPVPAGLTIEEIAARYLGDPDRWLDIARLNDLREPYIDDAGFTLPLTSPPEGRSLNVPADKRLFVGQRVILGDDATPAFARTVLDLRPVGETLLVTVSGLADLSLVPAMGAYLRAYLPGTVNAQGFIYVPTEDDPLTDDQSLAVPQARGSALAQVSKVDLLLSEQGDLVVGPGGDLLLASGLANIKQAFLLKLLTAKGSLLRDREYGLGFQAGESAADLDVQSMARSLEDMIASDPRFDGLDRADVALDGAKLSGNFRVRVANGVGVVPLSYAIE
jgi:hypothetical protein